MKITGVRVDTSERVAMFIVKLEESDTLGDVLRVANAIEQKPEPRQVEAGLPDEVRLARALETIEELRKEVTRLTAALTERDATCGKLKTSNDELAARLQEAGEVISQQNSFRRAVAMAVGLREVAEPSTIVITIDKLVAERDRLKAQATVPASDPCVGCTRGGVACETCDLYADHLKYVARMRRQREQSAFDKAQAEAEKAISGKDDRKPIPSGRATSCSCDSTAATYDQEGRTYCVRCGLVVEDPDAAPDKRGDVNG